jgi:hypothetical protein
MLGSLRGLNLFFWFLWHDFSRALPTNRALRSSCGPPSFAKCAKEGWGTPRSASRLGGRFAVPESFSGLYGTTEVVPFPRIGLYGSVASHPFSQSARRKGGAPRFEVDAGFLDFARDDRSWEMIHRAAEGLEER